MAFLVSPPFFLLLGPLEVPLSLDAFLSSRFLLGDSWTIPEVSCLVAFMSPSCRARAFFAGLLLFHPSLVVEKAPGTPILPASILGLFPPSSPFLITRQRRYDSLSFSLSGHVSASQRPRRNLSGDQTTALVPILLGATVYQLMRGVYK